MLFFWRMAIAGQMPSMRVDVGLLHPLEELARVRRQRLDVAALPFGVDRVEGERRLARAADAGHDDERAGGSVRSTFLRLCVRAPRTTIWPRGRRCGRHAMYCGLFRRIPEQSMVAQPAADAASTSAMVARPRTIQRALCYFVGACRRGRPGQSRRRRPALTKRGLCQSVCSSATCLTRRTKQSCGSICRASANPLRSCCRSIGKPAARAASRSSTTRTAPSPKRPSAGSTSSRSRDGRSRSARRGRAKSVRPGGRRGPAASAVRGPAASRGPRRTGGRRLRAPRPGGFAPRPDAGGGRAGGAAQPELRPRRAAQEQAQAAAQGRDRGPKGPIKERPVSRLYEKDEDWRAQDETSRRVGHRQHRHHRQRRRRHRRDRRLLDDEQD